MNTSKIGLMSLAVSTSPIWRQSQKSCWLSIVMHSLPTWLITQVSCCFFARLNLIWIEPTVCKWKKENIVQIKFFGYFFYFNCTLKILHVFGTKMILPSCSLDPFPSEFKENMFISWLSCLSLDNQIFRWEQHQQKILKEKLYLLPRLMLYQFNTQVYTQSTYPLPIILFENDQINMSIPLPKKAANIH
jgi:hypothetical protein